VPEEELEAYPIANIGPDDGVLALALPPDAGPTRRFVARVKQTGVQVTAVTDTPLSEITPIQDAVLHAPTAGTGSLNSMVAPMAIVEALLDGLSAFKRNQSVVGQILG
jgi:DNA-binding MurR/RpiR family transcriptional regulator